MRLERVFVLRKILKRSFFPILGMLSLIWFLVRVISKPSRAAYPCMRAAMPLASGFVLWMSGLVLSGLAFMRARLLLRRSHHLSAAVFVVAGMMTIMLVQDYSVDAKTRFEEINPEANLPIGVARGIFPGRVVWVYDADATNEDCLPGQFGHGWFLNENNDQEVTDRMLSNGLRSLTETSDDSSSWDAIFRYFNLKNGKGDVGYASDEIIFIKTNATSSWSGNINMNDGSKIYNQWYGISETSPQLVLSVLRQLVDVVGVPQQNIYVGDPMKHIYKHCIDIWYGEFPNVHYLDQSIIFGGREKVIPSNSAQIHYSDRGKVLHEGTWEDAAAGDPVYSDYLYTIFEKMDYMINIPTLKAHKHAGITAFAKNHFGSHTRESAKHLHNGLVAPEQYNPRRAGYGLYRVQVDLMGHELLGQKNLIFLMDGLWAADYEIGEPRKFTMTPFNNDWMSSIFLSQDNVAIESVGFDFLRAEFTPERGLETYPQMEGVDDYLHQSADSTTWPDGIYYDPENDGISIGSLGVHEHWNNADDKQYSRNLDTGQGIELIYSDNPVSDIAGPTSVKELDFTLVGNYPNPFNPATTIEFWLASSAEVYLAVYNLSGQKIRVLENTRLPAGTQEVYWNGINMNGIPVSSGTYVCRLDVLSEGKSYTQFLKMLLIR